MRNSRSLKSGKTLHASERIAGLRRQLIDNLVGTGALFVAAGGSGIKVMPPREKGMRNRRAAEENADVEARIAQIEQMTLDQIAVFQCRILTDVAAGRISPREVAQ